MSLDAMKQALVTLELNLPVIEDYGDKEQLNRQHATMNTLRERLEQPEQEPVDSAEKAGAYMDARLWEFIDMAAAWPEAKPDPRTWSHVMVYAPKPAQEPVKFNCTVVDDAHPEGVPLSQWGKQQKQKPFCYHDGRNIVGKEYAHHCDVFPLYTEPQPEQEPLTDEQISDLWCKVSNTDFVTADTHEFARAVEAKLK